MSERELVGRGRRVAGMLVAMLGAGVMLESAALWSGLVLLLVGTAVFAATFLSDGVPAVERSPEAQGEDEVVP